MHLYGHDKIDFLFKFITLFWTIQEEKSEYLVWLIQQTRKHIWDACE